MLVLISSIWAQRTKWTLTRALIGGAQPMEGWWAPVARPHKREVRTSGTMERFAGRHCSPPRNPNPIREGGLQRREAPPALPLHCVSPPCLHCTGRRRPERIYTTEPVMDSSSSSTDEGLSSPSLCFLSVLFRSRISCIM